MGGSGSRPVVTVLNKPEDTNGRPIAEVNNEDIQALKSLITALTTKEKTKDFMSYIQTSKLLNSKSGNANVTKVSKTELKNILQKIDGDLSKTLNGVDVNFNNKDEFLQAVVRNDDFKKIIDSNMSKYNIVLDDKQRETIYSMLEPIKNLKARHLYYQYKYVELNAFIILFVEKIQEVYENSIATAVLELKSRQEREREMFKAFGDLTVNMSKIAGDSDVIKQDEIQNLTLDAYDKIIKHQTDTLSKLTSLQSKQTIIEVLKGILDGNDELQKAVATYVNNPKPSQS